MADNIGLDRVISGIRRGGERTTGLALKGLESKRGQDRQAFAEGQALIENKQREKVFQMEALKNKLPYMDLAEQPSAITEMLNLAGIEGEFNPTFSTEWPKFQKRLDAADKDPRVTPQQKLELLQEARKFMTIPALKKPAGEVVERLTPEKVEFAKPVIKDYTPKSWKAYQASGDPADLEAKAAPSLGKGKSKDAFAYMKTVLQTPDEFGMVQELDAETTRKAALQIDSLIKQFPKASAQRIGELAIRRVEALPPASEAPGFKRTPVSIDKATAQQFLRDAGGDKEKARQLAKDAGYKF